MPYVNIVHIVQSMVRTGNANEGYVDMKIKRILIREKNGRYMIQKLHKFRFLTGFMFF